MAEFLRHASRRVRERSSPGKQGGFGGAAGPPNSGPSLQRGGMSGGERKILSKAIPTDDVIPDDFLEDFLGGSCIPMVERGLIFLADVVSKASAHASI